MGNETGRLGSETVMIRGVHFGAERAVEHRVCGLVVGGDWFCVGGARARDVRALMWNVQLSTARGKGAGGGCFCMSGAGNVV